MFGFSLQRDEQIIRVLRQSKWVLLKPLALAAIVFFVPWYYVSHYELSIYKTGVIFWSFLPLAYVLRSYKLWELQRYIITSKRLIKTWHQSVFKKIVVETPLDRILNVSFKTTGMLSVLGRYGDVEVQVVGLMEPIILQNITRPGAIKEYLWRAHAAVRAHDSLDGEHYQQKHGYTKENQRVL